MAALFCQENRYFLRVHQVLFVLARHLPLRTSMSGRKASPSSSSRRLEGCPLTRHYGPDRFFTGRAFFDSFLRQIRGSVWFENLLGSQILWLLNDSIANPI